MRSAQEALLLHATELVRPLVAATGSDERATQMAEQLARIAGWDLQAVPELRAGLDRLHGIAELVERLASILTESPDELSLDALEELLSAVCDAVDALAAFPSEWAPPGDLPAGVAETFVNDILAAVVDAHLAAWLPRTRALAQLAGAWSPAPDTAVEIRRGERVLRAARPRRRLDLAAVRETLTDPLGLLRRRYATPGADGNLAALADDVGPGLADALTHLGAVATYGTPGAETRVSGEALEAARRLLHVHLAASTGDDELAGDLMLVAALVPAADGVGLVLALSGWLDAETSTDGWSLAATLGGELGRLLVTRHGASLEGGATPDASLVVRAERPAAPDDPLLWLGPAGGTGLSVGGVAIRARARVDGTGIDAGVDIELLAARLQIAAGEADGFLASVLPPEPLTVDLPLRVGWSLSGGLSGGARAALVFPLALHTRLGPLEISGAALGLTVDERTVGLTARATLGLELGPVHTVVEEAGLAVEFALPSGTSGVGRPSLGFAPPSGIGLSIDAGPVVGGGYLFFDRASEQYAGAVELEFSSIALKAIGLLTTRMPDRSPGFSLLVIISAEFTPVQLGFGFTLSGVGGLLGVNRTASVEALRAGVRTRVLESVLFPPDPVANAPRIVSDLGALFPPAADRYVFGPLARLGWGSPTLLTLDLGLVLELPAPVRLIVLGRLHLALPREEAALVVINMDVLGVIDFDRGEASVDATLHDSRIAAFALTGDMAMRASWRGRSTFALSAGGFNPRFQPPAGFPALQRLAISLASGDNPRLRLEAYLALTSNTVQFGARLEIYATAIGLSIEGLLYFDALFQFDPFRFAVDMGGAIALKRGARELMAISIDLTLEGPAPWHACGRARFKILFIEAEVSFDRRFGSEERGELPAPVDVGGLLDAALADVRNWSAQLPPEGQSLFTVRDAPAGEAELVAHPLGALSFTQRVAPLGVELQRYGAAGIVGDTRFDITSLRVGAAGEWQAETLEELFAPAQFLDLSEDQKLSRPSFERLPAGRRVAGDSVEFDRTTLVVAPLAYETAIIDAPDVPARRLAPEALDGGALVRLAENGPAALAETRGTGRARFAASSLPLKLCEREPDPRLLRA